MTTQTEPKVTIEVIDGKEVAFVWEVSKTYDINGPTKRGPFEIIKPNKSSSSLEESYIMD